MRQPKFKVGDKVCFTNDGLQILGGLKTNEQIKAISNLKIAWIDQHSMTSDGDYNVYLNASSLNSLLMYDDMFELRE